MPKLPDYTSLGATPAPRTALGKTSYRYATGQETMPGQALVSIGQTISKFTDDIERENLRIDTLRAEDAFNKLRERQLDLSKGDDGFLKKRGADAVNQPLMQDYGKRFDQAVNEIAESLGNDSQKALFRKRSSISGLEYKQDLLSHITREKDTYAKQVFDATSKTEAANFVDRYLDPNGRNLSAERFNAALKAEAERNGWDEQVTNTIRQQWSSSANRGVIERHLADDNDILATDYYNRLKKQGFVFTEGDEIAVTRALDIAGTRGKAQRNSDRLLAKHGSNFGLAIEEAKEKITNPKEREATLSNIRQAKFDNETSIKLDENEAFTSALQYVQANGNTNFRPDLAVRISKEGHDALEKMAAEVREGRTPVNDTKKWFEFKEAAKDRNWLTGLSDSKFYGYLMSFGEEERDRASALRDAAVQAANGDANGKEFLRNDINLEERIRTNMFDSGIIERKKTGQKYSPEEEQLIDIIKQEAEKELEAISAKQKRKTTSEQEKEVVKRLIAPYLKVRIQKDWFIGFPPDPRKTIGELTPEELTKAYVPYDEVPDSDKKTLAIWAKGLGNTSPSENDIAKAYTTLITSQGLPKLDIAARIDSILGNKK